MTAAVLLIGGMDSSAGAGLLRDAATVARAGLPSRVAVTAVTAQTDAGVGALHPVPADVVRAQIASAAASGPVAAVKIGMLGEAVIADTVAHTIAGLLPAAPVVLDPVLRASSGRPLLDAAGLAVMIRKLLPRSSLVTPNLPELQHLGRAFGLGEGAEEAEVAQALLGQGCAAVLVKGGHGADPARSTDRLYRDGATVETFAAPRHPFALRGTGCQMASAIAAALAQGQSLEDAVARAKAAVAERFRLAAC
ncbi:hydroxymethylpyrimidine/phosphomethylpyrimidine kinase [Acidimangrovimonas pyrenivorans]|uniref:hydroxymethylpyrimidine kinase n=1 Tax=Acidimangrovimonas pyrenivorans TaxID=2030798 RepID=A0ABV7AHC6_9RHOB